MDKPIAHGTTTGYNYGCRCDECKQAAADAHRIRSRRKAEQKWSLAEEQHRDAVMKKVAEKSCGNPGAQRYAQGCRCEDCRYIMRSYYKRLRKDHR